MPKPDFIIIGAMKAGTTTLRDQLDQLPDISMSSPKEPCFFSNDEFYNKGVEWYESLFPENTKGTNILFGEASTNYTKLPTYPNTIARLYRHNPEVKLIYIIRHPVDRLVSHYSHAWLHGKMSERLNLAIRNRPELIEYSCYHKQISPFIKRFGTDQVLIVFFDRLMNASSTEFDRILRFIGCESKFVWNDQIISNVSSTKVRKNSAILPLLKNLPILKFLRKKIVPRGLLDWFLGFWMIRKKPRISEKNKGALTKIFDDDLSNLGRIMGVEISCRTWNEVADSAALD